MFNLSKLTKKAKKYYSIFNSFLSRKMQFFAIHCKFLNFKFRILKIQSFLFLELDDLKIREYKLAYDFEDLIYKIFKLIKNYKFNIIIFNKFLFLINYSSKREFYVKFAEDFIIDYEFNFTTLPNLFPYIISPFVLVGDYKFVDTLILILRQKKDKFYKREVALYNERSYLTYIGHLCLFSYYLKAREMNFLGKDNSTFLFNKNKISNNLFFNLIKKRAAKLNVTINETNLEYDYFNQEEHEIELWPCVEKKKYFLAREIYGLVDEKWDTQKNKPFFEFPNHLIQKAEELLKKNNINQLGKWFVGIHLRSSDDKRKLRNACYENIISICDQITSNGGEVFFIGTNNFMNLKNKNNIYFLNKLDISKSENELLQMYIWSKSSFFVGNLSGGTIPPGLFGTPTIYIDVHPTAQARPPSKFDTVIPKKVFDLKSNKYLSFNESNSYAHFRCQTESEYLAKFSGYRISPSDKNIIKEVVKFYMDKFVFQKKNLDNIFSHGNQFISQAKGASYKV